jgi:hypothetical protein
MEALLKESFGTAIILQSGRGNHQPQGHRMKVEGMQPALRVSEPPQTLSWSGRSEEVCPTTRILM